MHSFNSHLLFFDYETRCHFGTSFEIYMPFTSICWKLALVYVWSYHALHRTSVHESIVMIMVLNSACLGGECRCRYSNKHDMTKCIANSPNDAQHNADRYCHNAWAIYIYRPMHLAFMRGIQPIQYARQWLQLSQMHLLSFFTRLNLIEMTTECCFRNNNQKLIFHNRIEIKSIRLIWMERNE